MEIPFFSVDSYLWNSLSNFMYSSYYNFLFNTTCFVKKYLSFILSNLIYFVYFSSPMTSSRTFYTVLNKNSKLEHQEAVQWLSTLTEHVEVHGFVSSSKVKWLTILYNSGFRQYYVIFWTLLAISKTWS